MQDPDQKCRHFGISWHFIAFYGIFSFLPKGLKRNQIRFFRFFPTFRLFPTFILPDSTALVWIGEHNSVEAFSKETKTRKTNSRAVWRLCLQRFQVWQAAAVVKKFSSQFDFTCVFGAWSIDNTAHRICTDSNSNSKVQDMHHFGKYVQIQTRTGALF